MLIVLRVVLLALFIAAPVGGHSPGTDLRRLAADYAVDPALTRPVTFGLRIDGADWTVAAVPSIEGELAKVTVTRGAPEVPAFVYVTDGATFARIAAGELHALTLMNQARASGPALVELEPVNGLATDAAGRAAFLSASFHFFATG